MASAIAAARRALRHLARIRYRLLLVNVLVAAVPIGGIAFAEMHERQLLAALERDMIHQAQLVRAFVLAGPPRPIAEHERMLARAARDTRTRIRLLDAAGEAVADSHRAGPPEGAEPPVPYLLGGESPRHAPAIPQPLPLAERREVRQALAGRYGSATRLWSNKERVYLFAALPVVRDGRPASVSDASSRTPGTSDQLVVVVYVTRSTQDVKLQLLRLRAWLVELLAATVLAATLLSLLLAMTIERPLDRLRRRAQRIAAQQPVEPSAPDERLTARADEIGELARAVAAMTDELQRRAHDARTLAADLSHELKNPLAGIRGAAELLRDGAAEEPEPRDRFLGMIVDDTARLDRIVSRLLEVARVEDDRGVALPVDLAALARACADRPWPVPVDVAAQGDAVVAGRSAQLAAAIENLVANATQHAEPGSRVEIELAAPRGRAGALRLTVKNRGPALSEAARRKVWDRFYSTRTAAGGSGLGLAIVRSVALAHGGAVGVACAGGVTSFWIELPRGT
jgi:two-component system, OmpR family, sensor histidine kinase ChvG